MSKTLSHFTPAQKDLPVPSLLMNLRGVSALTSEDAHLFRTRFHASQLCYANSWLYILRSTRNDSGELGFKYSVGKFLIGLGYRDQVIYLTRGHGDVSVHTLADVCASLLELTGCRIVLKKVDEETGGRLLALPHFHSCETETHSGLLEDEAFPEHQISLDFLFSSDFRLNPAAKNLEKKARQFAKTGSRLLAEFNSPLDPEEIIRKLPALTHGNHNKRTAYVPLIREVFPFGSGSPAYLSCLFHDEQEIHGLYIGEVLRPGTMGLYCAISSRRQNGITEWMDVCFLEHAFRNGINTVLLGGSETSGVDQYVKKLLPAIPPYAMMPLIYH